MGRFALCTVGVHPSTGSPNYERTQSPSGDLIVCLHLIVLNALPLLFDPFCPPRWSIDQPRQLVHVNANTCGPGDLQKGFGLFWQWSRACQLSVGKTFLRKFSKFKSAVRRASNTCFSLTVRLRCRPFVEICAPFFSPHSRNYSILRAHDGLAERIAPHSTRDFPFNFCAKIHFNCFNCGS